MSIPRCTTHIMRHKDASLQLALDAVNSCH